ncbi:branched-chain amino acid aminotransferase [Thermosporothrix hazakensis]|jgi:branched-chain amino acid aminotransferase|uniref:Branched-chain amino acid aminotransferase n=1 Tax=Thermosporothrix hazakensis TaxID=644383 RepID=A0A326U8T6_THEHA|nr:aminotransferase class IV [Thermosporothrix hazakensis]PZW30675.1 branched-chain amino acid aminotransferase [Thermosporothrix hazakensis]GCE49537.1 branched chain amino acid aminotransferase [Thermosporothrix hazakensis]
MLDTSAIWYVGGKWVHPNEATLSINDVAVLRSYCVFEGLRTYNRRPFHLHDHLMRLFHSASLIDLEVPYTLTEIAAIIHEVIERNTYTHASIRVLVTGGESEDGVLPTGKPVLAVLITPLPERDMERFERGIKVITARIGRELPEAKTSNYVQAIRALKAAARQNAADALYVNAEGEVLEGTRSNFFIFRGDALITPREGVLSGITRDTVLKLAQGRFAIEERPILVSELPEIDEAFLSSSSKEITPVVQIDDLVIGSGKAGKRTYELEQRFIDMVQRGDF